jgi:hypothetical protein
MARLLRQWAKSLPLGDLSNAVPDKSEQQSSHHGAAENNEAEKAPSHGLVPTMRHLRVNPPLAMAQCCPGPRRVN